MAVVKLYPPNLAGTLPSFYSNGEGATNLVVPFSMNISVASSSISGFNLRIKSAATDIILAELNSTNYELSDNTVTFELDSKILNKLVVGSFYKIQLAYIDIKSTLGYYSTTTVIKYTNIPSVKMMNLNPISVTTITSQQLIGTYQNEDSTEKVYQYKFDVYDQTKNIIETSGWLQHNTQNDNNDTSSQDSYSVKTELVVGDTYMACYSIKTNNSMEVKSQNYEIVFSEIGTTDPGYSLVLGEQDYENGGVEIIVKQNGSNSQLKGTFLLTRTSSESNYKVWEILNNLTIDAEMPYTLTDYTVAAGVGYRYGLQRYNSSNVYSKKIKSDIITPYFEDLFLSDGSRQLKVRFNPQVSSFKPVVQESTTVTLGKKFPYILRNGIVDYKQMQISGLISYLMDNDEFFVSKEELELNFSETTDITDENVAVERRFKTAVLDWLNDGKTKLFRSPYEGNYLVRLTSVSLSPQDSLSRMIHTFNCTATEVAEYTTEALEDFNLIPATEKQVVYEETKVISLAQFVYSFLSVDDPIAAIKNFDLTEGYPCRKIEITYWQSNSEKRNGISFINLMYGTTFQWGDATFSIDRSGVYELELEKAITTPLKITRLANSIENSSNPKNSLRYYQKGYVILTLQKESATDLDSIQNSTFQYLCGYGANGFDEDLTNYSNIGQDNFSRNIVNEFNTNKSKISSIKYIDYKVLPVVSTGNSELNDSWWKNFLGLANDIPENNYFYNNRIIIYSPSAKTYYKKTDTGFEAIDNYNTKVIVGSKVYDLSSENPSSTDMPYNEYGGLNLQVGVGTAAYIYGTAQTFEYGIESTREELIAAKQEEATAYEDLCAALYNFHSIEKDSVTEGMELFAFDNRRFIQIDYESDGNYAYDTLYVNKGIEDFYDEETLKTKRNTYLQAKINLGILLDNSLLEEE